MNRPDVLNALSAKMFENMRGAIAKAARSGNVQFLAIRGSGGAFSAGLDIREVSGFSSRAEARDFVYKLVKPFWEALLSCDKPVLALVDGPAYGAGAEIVLSSDIVLASARSHFAFSGGRVGALCCISGVLGPLLMDGRKLVEMNLTGEPIPAAAALKLGLANYVVPSNKLDLKADELIGKLRNVSPFSNSSFKHIRRAMIPRSLLEIAYRELLGTITSPDFRKGSTAFITKKPPDYG